MATSTLRALRALRNGFLALLPCFAPSSAWALEGLTPIPVVHSIEIEDAGWLPLPADDLRRAVGDAALSRLTDAGRLQLVTGTPTPDAGLLYVDIAMIAAGQAAKATITLDMPGSPTMVATASISLGDVKFANLHSALEHVGERAADRLVAKLDRVRTPQADDPARKRIYDAGQAAKGAGRYAEAAASFEAVVASGSDPRDVLRQLAEDELRYGLPVFEARQELNRLGQLSLPGQDLTRRVALARAENLYRQIQAENPYNVQRVSEAQRALDNMIVMRGALANARRAGMLSQVSALRIGVMERVAMEGSCPDKKQMEQLIAEMRVKVQLDATRMEGRGARFYELSDPTSETRIGLRCADYRAEIVDLDSASDSPAASR